MKKYLLAVCFAFGMLHSFAQEGFTLKVKLSNLKNYTPYIGYLAGGKYVIDSSYTRENDRMVFKGKVTEPALARFGLRRNPATMILRDKGYIPGPVLQFFLTNETITIEGDADEEYMAKVQGGKANAEWAVVKPQLDELVHQNWVTMKSTYDNFKPGGDSVVFKKLITLQYANADKEVRLKLDFIDKNPGSLVSMYFLSSLQNYLSPVELKTAYGKLSDTYKSNAMGKDIATRIVNMEATAIGRKAIAIQKKDINGNPVNLETLKGKYVLLDFWGSWCRPCRESHPHLKALYAKYKADGFEIVGIAQEKGPSVEAARKAWTTAIEQDGATWLQVLNNEDIETFNAVKAYGINAFPTRLLLDKEGKIIANYMGDSEDIDLKLKHIFGR